MKYAFYIQFFRVLMPQWETALLPWDLLCSPGTIAWGGDEIATDIATTRPKRPKGRFGENIHIYIYIPYPTPSHWSIGTYWQYQPNLFPTWKTPVALVTKEKTVLKRWERQGGKHKRGSVLS